jgi:dTDP-4-amino-4,6-dideoxygalactose transaminase
VSDLEDIPQVDVGAAFCTPIVSGEMARVTASGYYILGPEVAAFERSFASFLGVAHGVGVGSGTDAVELALRAVGVIAGDRVLTVSHTAVATVSAIRRCGAVPVFADIDCDTYVMSPETLRDALSREEDGSIRAVVVVHLYGCPADMPEIMNLARHAGLSVIEDCAQAHGALVAGRSVGSWGDAAAFSFYPTKNLGAMGDGGLVATNDAALSERLNMLRQYGWRQRYISSTEGINSRLDELQAAILNEFLPLLDGWNCRRREIGAAYDALLAGSPVVRPVVPVGREHVYHQYVIQVVDRDVVRAKLRKAGIGTAIHYPLPVHQQPAYEAYACNVELPVSEAISGRILSLPMFPELTDEQVRRVGETVRDVLR